MKVNIVGPFIHNAPFGTECAFRNGLIDLGVDVRTWDPNVELPDLYDDADANVIFKSCVGREDLFRGFDRHRTVLYQPDDMRFQHVRQLAVDMLPFCEHFLSFDAASARVAEGMGYRNCRQMLVTADPTVYYPDEASHERSIDVCMIASLGDPVAHRSRRRIAQMATELGREHGWKVLIQEGIRDPEMIRRIYCSSKVVINHATDVGQQFGLGYGYQCRHFEVALTGTTFLTNCFADAAENRRTPFCLFNDETAFVCWLERLVADVELRGMFVDAQRDWLNESHLPVSRAAELVKYLEEVTA